MSSDAQRARSEVSPEIQQLRARIDRSARGPVLSLIGAGVAWLVAASLLGFLSSLKLHAPSFLESDFLSFLHFGRLRPAFTTAFIYGWGAQVGLGVAIWIMSRLCKVPFASRWIVYIGIWIWNLTVLAGIVAILSGGSTSMDWLEFPKYLWPFFFIGHACISVWVILAFRLREKKDVFVSEYYILGAAFWFPWVFVTANLLLHHFPQASAVMGAAVDAWYQSALLLLFFVPLGLAAVYYMIPKVTARPIFSQRLALIGFWGIAILSGWIGIQRFMGGPLPAWMSAVGGLASILLLIPVAVVGLNHHLSLRGDHGIVQISPTMRFVVFGAICYTIMSVLGAGFATITFGKLVQFTHAQHGFHLLALYGFFSMVMFGSIYFILPRLCGCEWPSSKLINYHFLGTAYGLGALLLCLFAAGIYQAASMNDAGNWSKDYYGPVATSLGWLTGASVAWFFLLFANTVFFFHVVLMALRLGKRSTEATLIGHSHEEHATAH